MNRKVGRAVLCAPTAATAIPCPPQDGAHGVTRPTSANGFMVPMRDLEIEEASKEPWKTARYVSTQARTRLKFRIGRVDCHRG